MYCVCFNKVPNWKHLCVLHTLRSHLANVAQTIEGASLLIFVSGKVNALLTRAFHHSAATSYTFE